MKKHELDREATPWTPYLHHIPNYPRYYLHIPTDLKEDVHIYSIANGKNEKIPERVIPFPNARKQLGINACAFKGRRKFVTLQHLIALTFLPKPLNDARAFLIDKKKPRRPDNVYWAELTQTAKEDTNRG